MRYAKPSIWLVLGGAWLSTSMTGCAVYSPELGQGLGAAHQPALTFNESQPSQLKVDQEECSRFASSASSTTQSTLTGMTYGGLVGAGLAALTEGKKLEGAVTLIGASVGAFNGFLKSEKIQREEVRRCMQGKGYALTQGLSDL